MEKGRAFDSRGVVPLRRYLKDTVALFFVSNSQSTESFTKNQEEKGCAPIRAAPHS